jgi:hypothetical protein
MFEYDMLWTYDILFLVDVALLADKHGAFDGAASARAAATRARNVSHVR